MKGIPTYWDAGHPYRWRTWIRVRLPWFLINRWLDRLRPEPLESARIVVSGLLCKGTHYLEFIDQIVIPQAMVCCRLLGILEKC
jgi:hypothetical protein